MHYSTPVQTTPPAAEPLLLANVKSFLRVDSGDTSQDSYLTELISETREEVESYLEQQLITATWQWSLDSFFGTQIILRPGVQTPYGMMADAWRAWLERGSPWGVLDNGMILLPRPPLQLIGSIQYVDTSGNTQTLGGSLYQVDTYSRPARVTPAYGQIWPTTENRMNAVTITFTSGYGASGSYVPFRAKQAMRLAITSHYEERGMSAVERSRWMALLDGLWHGGY